MAADEGDPIVHSVVVHHEERHSIWAANRILPLAWRYEGEQGPKQSYLDYIVTAWTDMPPSSSGRECKTPPVSRPPAGICDAAARSTS